MTPPVVIPQPDQEDPARAFEAARMRPCLLCGSAGDPAFRRCSEQYREIMPVLVIVREPVNELAMVPVTWDAKGGGVCPAARQVQ
ncbi:MAG: hypothetical protein OXC11_02295 [Rhodospirillales bacterium]|nr:hypothetical protein [Rhodospirillales bacterium]